ncbi:MAG: penicillin-binding protein 2 [Candidatus Omnitrophica bacterium]|nr:penicillin-binding protein 2 [Candidatus Omnitrophota bacterium]
MMRSRVLFIFFVCLFFVLSLGLVHLTVVRGTELKDLSERNCIRLLPQPGARGKIFDRNGEAIVQNRLSYDVLVLAEKLNRLEKVLRTVSEVLELDFSVVQRRFRQGFSGKSIPVTVARNIDRRRAITLEELKIDLPGLIIQPNPVREYPHGRLACHLIGYINQIDRWRLTKLENYGYKTKDLVGFMGVEEKYDYYLRQEEGGLSFEVDHRGRLSRTLGFKHPENGRDIRLTLDTRVQGIAEEVLGEQKGAVVVMDPHTGEVIAMVSRPAFDPSVFVREDNKEISALFRDKDSPLINRAVSGVYPPGSVFKPIVAVAALEEKVVSPEDTFLCTGKSRVGSHTFKCWDVHGPQNVADSLQNSCNVFYYRVGIMLRAQTIYNYAIRFGLAKATPFELPYEASGFMPSPLWRKLHKFKGWYDGDTANISIGQGEVLVTPLQIARMMAVFANGGYLVNPYITGAVDGKPVTKYRKRVHLSISDATMRQITGGLRDVVLQPGGTGHVLADLPVAVAGKTGTAQAPPGNTHAWFVGYFPFRSPRYVICVFLERGGPGHVACLKAREIIGKMRALGLG